MSFRDSDPRRRVASGAALVLGFTPATVLACSGSRTGELMAESMQYGFALLAINAGLVVVGIVAAARHHAPVRGPLALLLLAVLHPGWWMSPFTGDCGHGRALHSITATAITGLVLVSPLFSGTPRWRVGGSIALAALTVGLAIIMRLDGRHLDLLTVAPTFAPAVLACGVGCTEYLLGAPFVTTLDQWDSIEAWKRRVVYVAALPLATLAVVVVLSVVGLAHLLITLGPQHLRHMW